MSNAHPPRALANTPEAALNLLIEGNARYVANAPRERDFLGRPRESGARSGAVRRHPWLRRFAGRTGVGVRPGPGRPVRGACRRQFRDGRMVVVETRKQPGIGCDRDLPGPITREADALESGQTHAPFGRRIGPMERSLGEIGGDRDRQCPGG
jgi:hypothetical protein